MSIKLLVNNTATSEAAETHVFEEDSVLIGRGLANRLRLTDPDKTVSKTHAEIRRDGPTVYLVDHGSKNLTYLNGAPLEPGQPKRLKDEDEIRIGVFELEFRFEADPAPPEPTPPEPAPPEPVAEQPAPPEAAAAPPAPEASPTETSPTEAFQSEIAAFAAGLRRLCAAYDREVQARGKEAAQRDLRTALDPATASHEVLSAIAGRPAQAPPPGRTNLTALDLMFGRLLNVVLESLTKLLGIPRQFQYEMLSHTLFDDPESAFLYQGQVDILKNHLLDPSVSKDVTERRMALMKEALDNLERHQIAMLDGYRAVVREGPRRLLDELDPNPAHDERRMIPLLGRLDALKVFEQKRKELLSEDWTVVEQTVYRPAFIDAYLARMRSTRR